MLRHIVTYVLSLSFYPPVTQHQRGKRKIHRGIARTRAHTYTCTRSVPFLFSSPSLYSCPFFLSYYESFSLSPFLFLSLFLVLTRTRARPHAHNSVHPACTHSAHRQQTLYYSFSLPRSLSFSFSLSLVRARTRNPSHIRTLGNSLVRTLRCRTGEERHALHARVSNAFSLSHNTARVQPRPMVTVEHRYEKNTDHYNARTCPCSLTRIAKRAQAERRFLRPFLLVFFLYT